MSASAFAVEGEHRVSANGFRSGNWSYRPIYTLDPSPHVTDILATATDQSLIGDNLSAVIYHRSGNTWTASSWPTTTLTDAVRSVKAMLTISSADDLYWQISGDLAISAGPSVAEPLPYNAGVLEQDIFHDVIANSENPSEIVQFLVDVGYEAAAVPLETQASVCPIAAQLNAIASSTEWGLTQHQSGDVDGNATRVGMAMLAAAVACPIPACTPGPVGGWVVGAATAGTCNYVYTGHSWTPATGGGNFVCEYEVRHYFTQNQSCTWRRGDCTTYTCTQTRTGYSSSPITCSTWAPTGEALPTCPASPSCVSGPVTLNAECSSTAATTWVEWGPACLQ